MPLGEYLLKFSLSLAVLYLFYRTVLRQLTFYQWNRFFLLLYSLLAFIMPCLNITPWIRKQGIVQDHLVSKIPTMHIYALQVNEFSSQMNMNDWLLIFFCTGTIIMLIRLIIRFNSVRRIRNNSVLLDSDGKVRIYETISEAGPFSFGNSIYLNTRLHSNEELKRILQHEIVHVKQQHTIDLVLGEALCIVNWYNPFAWLIRNAIRQNLEFIADNNVLAKGHDKKEYQYLLLKVTGVPQYSIATHFNLPHLKKRIAMMNKMKTARLHLMKFLFALPLLVFILLAFRTEQAVTIKQALPSFKDTVPGVSQRNASAIARPAIAPAPVTINSPSVNNMGYILSVADDNGECVVIIKDKNRKIIRAMTLEDWNKNKSQNEKQYGKIPPPPRPPVPPLAPRPPLPPAAPVIVTENENTITVDGEIVTVENDEENDVEAADNDKEDVEEAEVEEPDPAALR